MSIIGQTGLIEEGKLICLGASTLEWVLYLMNPNNGKNGACISDAGAFVSCMADDETTPKRIFPIVKKGFSAYNNK